jgi:hypothetical protein
VDTVIHYAQRGNAERQPRGERRRRAARLAREGARPAQGLSQRHAAQRLPVPRTTLHAWRLGQDRGEAWPQVGACCVRVPGLACLHRLVWA